MSLLAIDKLNLSVDGKPLVSDLSFTIAPGERLGLIGESGSGKSLTAMAATGLLPRAIKAGGSVLLGGQQVIGAPDRVLDGLRGTVAAFVFQEPLTALDPLVRVGRQVAEPAGTARWTRAWWARVGPRGACSARAGGAAAARSHRTVISARDFGRAAAAGGDCHGAGVPAAASDRR